MAYQNRLQNMTHIKPKMIFHAPFPLNENATSASGIRPVKMRQAFIDSGYDVINVTGTEKERKIALKNIQIALKNGEEIDFLYSESSTMPSVLTGKYHLPFNSWVDQKIFRTAKKHNIPVGLFYRDIYWRFPIYRKTAGIAATLYTYLFYKQELHHYSQTVSTLFLPSAEMAKYLPELAELPTIALPPGGELNISKPDEIKNKKLQLLYVGGVGENYKLHHLVKAITQVPECELTICTRVADWNAAKNEYEKFTASNWNVVHLSGSELKEIYKNSDIAILFTEPQKYWDFAYPLKLSEYITQGKPIIASAGSLTGTIVNKLKIGWSIPYTTSALISLLQDLLDSPEKISQATQRTIAEAPEHTWNKRAQTVIQTLRPNFD
ncbi:MAG: glycosyltransferase [Arcanobacterium sp.]|nr:glycosyltransferase [Arcanobacterium sp.]